MSEWSGTAKLNGMRRIPATLTIEESRVQIASSGLPSFVDRSFDPVQQVRGTVEVLEGRGYFGAKCVQLLVRDGSEFSLIRLNGEYGDELSESLTNCGFSAVRVGIPYPFAADSRFLEPILARIGLVRGSDTDQNEVANRRTGLSLVLQWAPLAVLVALIVFVLVQFDVYAAFPIAALGGVLIIFLWLPWIAGRGLIPIEFFGSSTTVVTWDAARSGDLVQTGADELRVLDGDVIPR